MKPRNFPERVNQRRARVYHVLMSIPVRSPREQQELETLQGRTAEDLRGVRTKQRRSSV